MTTMHQKSTDIEFCVQINWRKFLPITVQIRYPHANSTRNTRARRGLNIFATRARSDTFSRRSRRETIFSRDNFLLSAQLPNFIPLILTNDNNLTRTTVHYPQVDHVNRYFLENSTSLSPDFQGIIQHDTGGKQNDFRTLDEYWDDVNKTSNHYRLILIIDLYTILLEFYRLEKNPLDLINMYSLCNGRNSC